MTPSPSATSQAIDRQPGELADTERTLAELAAGRGAWSVIATRDGGTLMLVDASTGAARQIVLASPDEVAGAVASGDGSTVAVLRRAGGRLLLELFGESGEPRASLDLTDAAVGSPVARLPGTPAALQSAEAVTRDRLEIAPDGMHVVVVSRDGDLTIVSMTPAMAVVRVIEDFGDVSALGWTGDGTLALVATYDASRSTGNLTGVPLEGRLRSILRLPANDGRRIVSLASPGTSADVFYVIRSVVDDWTAQNNLYRIPLGGGTPSVVLATGIVGPAGAVDRFAVSDDGRTVAASLLIPRGDDLVFHSLWVNDIDPARPLEVETGALGLVSRLSWTGDGLFVVGVQRERTASMSKLVTVSLRLDPSGALTEIGRSESAATPVGSPVGSPGLATPAAPAG